MRSLFLGETLYGIIAISVSIIGQLIVFLSMYCSPIYAALWKPHAITLLVIRIRRYIHQTFSLLLLFYCSFYLGRAPLLFLKIKNDDIGDKDDDFCGYG
jgi:hypothetical protein